MNPPIQPSSIDLFLQAVFGKAAQEIGNIQPLRQRKGYLCPAASDLAIHLILELYDQASTPQANITRISSNLELAAEELLFMSRRIRAKDPRF